MSLRALQQQLERHRWAGLPLPEDLEFFGRLTGLRALVIDRPMMDTIVVGEVVSTLPKIRTDDFASAVRAARGLPNYPPGMSLDPPVNGAGARSEADACPDAYVVRLINLAPDQHFTKVCIVADGTMKDIASARLRVPGIPSYWDLGFERVRETVKNCGTVMPEQRSLSRLWFHPAEPTFQVGGDGDVVVAKRWDIQLLTELESLERRRTTGPAVERSVDPIAQAFCELVTAGYDRLAAGLPEIYESLRACFRLIASLEVVKHLRAPLDYDYWLYRHPIAHVATSWTWPRVVRQEAVHCERVAPPYRYRYEYRFSVCGGVSIAYRMQPRQFSAAPPERSSRLRAAVLSSRPSPMAVAWTVPVQTLEALEV